MYVPFLNWFRLRLSTEIEGVHVGGWDESKPRQKVTDSDVPTITVQNHKYWCSIYMYS